MLKRFIAKFRRSKPLDKVETHDKEIVRLQMNNVIVWYFTKCQINRSWYTYSQYCSEVTACYLLSVAGIKETYENMNLMIETYNEQLKDCGPFFDPYGEGEIRTREWMERKEVKV